ncbi:MAG: DUF4382 domain-containing protein [Armatimonadota bacterium]
MRAITLILSGLLLTAFFVLAGCGGGGSGESMVRLVVGDAPLHLDDGTVVTEVNAEIVKVELIANESEDSPRVTLFEGSETINLLALANKPVAQLPQLGMVAVPPGTYTQMRLIVNEAGSNVVLEGGDVKPLKVASGEQTGLKVVDLSLTVVEGVTTVVLLDFDLSKLHQNKQFLLTPNAIRVVKLNDAGTVTGTLALPANATGTATVTDVVSSLVLHRAGSTDAIAFSQVVLNSAATAQVFTINGIPAGTDYVLTSNTSYQDQTSTFDIPPAPGTITVTPGGTTDLGTTEVQGITF